MRRHSVETMLKRTERLHAKGAGIRDISLQLGVLSRTTYRYLKILEGRGVKVQWTRSEETRRKMSGGRGAQPRAPRIKEPPACVCGMPKSSHPTKSCREFFEKGC